MASAHGCMGTSPGLRSAARFRRYFGLGFQIPERSGLPYGIFGAGAVRFGLPSAVRGTLGVLLVSHCAEAEQLKSPANAMIRRLCMMLPVIRCQPGLYTRQEIWSW